MSDPASIISDYARRELLYALASMEHRCGKAATGVVIEAQLEAIGLHLHGSLGREAAFAVMQRHADRVFDFATPRIKQS